MASKNIEFSIIIKYPKLLCLMNFILINLGFDPKAPRWAVSIKQKRKNNDHWAFVIEQGNNG